MQMDKRQQEQHLAVGQEVASSRNMNKVECFSNKNSAARSPTVGKPAWKPQLYVRAESVRRWGGGVASTKPHFPAEEMVRLSPTRSLSKRHLNYSRGHCVKHDCERKPLTSQDGSLTKYMWGPRRIYSDWERHKPKWQHQIIKAGVTAKLWGL